MPKVSQIIQIEIRSLCHLYRLNAKHSRYRSVCRRSIISANFSYPDNLRYDCKTIFLNACYSAPPEGELFNYFNRPIRLVQIGLSLPRVCESTRVAISILPYGHFCSTQYPVYNPRINQITQSETAHVAGLNTASASKAAGGMYPLSNVSILEATRSLAKEFRGEKSYHVERRDRTVPSLSR